MRNYYILIVSIIFISGLILTSLAFFAPVSGKAFAVFSVFLFMLLAVSINIKSDFLFIASFFTLVFILGIICYNLFNTIDGDNIKNYARYLLEGVRVEGRVTSDPQRARSGKKKTFILETDSIESKGKRYAASGFVLVNLYKRKAPLFRYGDIVVLEGLLHRPFSYKKESSFDYRQYLADKRIYSVLDVKKGSFVKKIGDDKSIASRFRRGIYSVRSNLASNIDAYFTPPYSAVLKAVLLGKRESLPPGLNSLFRKTGTLHILAISGLHAGIIYFVLRVILKIFRVERNLSVVLSILFLALFTVLTGARASILRAATMFSIIGFGEVLKRKISIFNLIGLSSLIVLILNPNQVFDIGFIFSYTAVLSIISMAPLFYEFFNISLFHSGGGIKYSTPGMFRRFLYYISASVSVSLAAWLGISPLVAYYFGLVSPIALAANIVVIPLLFMVMGSGILFLSLGFLSKSLAYVFSQSTWFFLFALINSARVLKNIPLGYFEIKPPSIHTILLYYVVILSGLLGVKYVKTQKNTLFSS